MYSDFYFDCGIFVGDTNGIFNNAVLRFGIFYFCGDDDFVVWIFIVVISYCIRGGVGAGALSDKSTSYSVGFDDGAESKICDSTFGVDFGACGCVGDCDVAVNFVWFVDENIWMDRRNTVCTDLSYDYDVLYVYLCNGLFIFIL